MRESKLKSKKNKKKEKIREQKIHKKEKKTFFVKNRCGEGTEGYAYLRERGIRRKKLKTRWGVKSTKGMDAATESG